MSWPPAVIGTDADSSSAGPRRDFDEVFAGRHACDAEPPSGPAIASMRIDIAVRRLGAKAQTGSHRFSLRVADDSVDPRHSLRDECERGIGDLCEANRNRLRLINVDRARVVRDPVPVVLAHLATPARPGLIIMPPISTGAALTT